jgi:hypothetical protein
MIELRHLAAIAVASLAIGATAFAAPFRSGSASVQAEAACKSQNVNPNSSTWELCLSHVTRAYEWGEPSLAQQLAQAAGNARESCLDQGFDAESSGYRACVSREMDARSQLMILGDDTSGQNVAQTPQ